MQKRAYAVLKTLHGKLPATREIAILKSDFAIGRSSTADLQLEDARISRLQAMIYYRQDGWFIQDKSTNQNTLVNGKRVQAARLKNGDHITIGDNEFVFYIAEAPSESSSGFQVDSAKRGEPPLRKHAEAKANIPAAIGDRVSPLGGKRFLWVLLFGGVGFVILLWLIGVLYFRNQLAEAKTAYLNGDCSTALSFLNPYTETQWTILFPFYLKQAKELTTECQAFLKWQQIIEQLDTAASKQAYIDLIQAFPNSPLVEIARQQIIQTVQETEGPSSAQPSCAFLLPYTDFILEQIGRDGYVALVLKCGTAAETSGLYEKAFENYLEAIHRYPYDLTLTPIYQALAKNPFSCQQLDRLESDPSINNAKSILIDLYQNCIRTYVEIQNEQEGVRLLDKLIRLMRQESLSEELEKWLGEQTFYCGWMDQLNSLFNPPDEGDLLLQTVKHCEQVYIQQGDFGRVIRMFDNLLPLSGETLKRSYTRLLYNFATTFRRIEVNLIRLRLAPSNLSQIEILNSTPYSVRLVFISEGVDLTIDLPDCAAQEGCVDNYGRCTASSPKTTLSLPPGNYEGGVLWLNPEPVDGAAFSFDIANQSLYQWCLIR